MDQFGRLAIKLPGRAIHHPDYSSVESNNNPIIKDDEFSYSVIDSSTDKPIDVKFDIKHPDLPSNESESGNTPIIKNNEILQSVMDSSSDKPIDLNLEDKIT